MPHLSSNNLPPAEMGAMGTSPDTNTSRSLLLKPRYRPVRSKACAIADNCFTCMGWGTGANSDASFAIFVGATGHWKTGAP